METSPLRPPPKIALGKTLSFKIPFKLNFKLLNVPNQVSFFFFFFFWITKRRKGRGKHGYNNSFPGLLRD